MKYEFTSETKIVDGHTLHRIRATEYIRSDHLGTIKPGELGGWIESEKNLDRGYQSWIADNACVYGNARVNSYAAVDRNAKVYGNAVIDGAAYITDNAEVFDNAIIIGYSFIEGTAKIGGHSFLFNGDRNA